MMSRFVSVVDAGVGTSSDVRSPTRPVGLPVVTGASEKKLDSDGCGSASTINTRASFSSAKIADRLAHRVVFPTPPLVAQQTIISIIANC